MRYYVYYKMADIIIRLGTDFEYCAEKGYMFQFLTNPVSVPDYCIEFYKTDNIDNFFKITPKMKMQTLKCHYYQDDSGREQCFHLYNGTYYHAVTSVGEKTASCHYICREWLRDSINEGYPLVNFFCLDKILMKFQCMILHSCHIHYNKKAILFSAPSGTGKSTQGDLWKQYAGAEVINGDRTAIRKVNGQWNAYGIPFCGTSGIHENKQAPLRAIAVIHQSKENQVEPLRGREAFCRLYSELTVNSWNIDFVNAATDWTMDLIQDVPILRFGCTKEPDAVVVLEQYLKERCE